MSAKKITIPAHSAVTVQLTLDASLPNTRKPGTYTAVLNLTHNTPYVLAPITVSMSVKAGSKHRGKTAQG
ncbi:hypothetical protein PV350_42155 [Streptomyces sp. PA03-6a]|nr:hypothetical protein [Streptomyces sp. PA03-6a]